MEYLKSGWKTVVGTQSSVPDDKPNVAETVERLVERVETSTLLEDRRDACRALKSLSKSYRLEVGTQAMDPLLFVLQNDSNDNEIVAFALEALNNIIEGDSNSETDLSIQFTEIFIKRKENVQIIIDLLADFDFKIRWPTIKLLYSLLRNKLRECQDCILTYPMGISRMMDLLLDPREVIRNDALLILVYLTKNNTNIQKIVAFENAFDRILDIVSTEGCSDGGVIVEDCLSILLNLLKTNTSNQNFFKEGSYINKLLPFLDFSLDTNWNPQKINNLLLMFKVIRSLVSPKNPYQVTSACQVVMNKNEVLQKLCAIFMSNGIPTEILTETINCVAEVIRGNQVNQAYLNRLNAPIDPPKPIIIILLMTMINDKQPFELRCAALYCFQCFLYKNDLGQAQIIETLLPAFSDGTSKIPSAGQLLCSGFFNFDSLSNWFVAVALSYTLLGNVTQKEQLLRVQLSADADSPPLSLLAYCSNLLQQGGHYQRRISLLMLLSIWLANSPVAVTNFLNISTNVPYLTSQVGLIESDEIELMVQGLCAFLLGICICYNDDSVESFTKDDLCKIITNRVGKEIFVDKLSLISKNEKYSQAIQKPQLSYLKGSDVLFDYEFCNLFRTQEGSILKIIQSSNDQNSNVETNLSTEDHKLLMKYKELIRKQDEQLTVLKKQLTDTKTEKDFISHQLNEQHSIIQQLRDQIALLKAQTSLYNPLDSSPDNTNQMTTLQVDANYDTSSNKSESNQVEYLINENRRLLSIIDQYKYWEQNFYAYYHQTPESLSTQVNVSDSDISRNISEPDIKSQDSNLTEADKLKTELDTIKKEQEKLVTLLGDQNIKIQCYEKEFKDRGLSLDINSMHKNNNYQPHENNTLELMPSNANHLENNLPDLMPSIANHSENNLPDLMPPMVNHSDNNLADLMPLNEHCQFDNQNSELISSNNHHHHYLYQPQCANNNSNNNTNIYSELETNNS